jgi:VanZ family protein
LNSSIQEPGVKEADEVRPSRWRAWAYVALMMVCILLTLPTAPYLWKAALKVFGKGFNDAGYLLFLFIFAGIGFHAGKRFTGPSLRALSLLFGFALVYFYLLKYVCHFPAERLHLIEYGLLSLLAFRALRLDLSALKSYAFGFLIAAAFGFVDELIQGVLDNRVYETRDVAINVISAGLSLLVVGILFRPNSADVSTLKT